MYDMEGMRKNANRELKPFFSYSCFDTNLETSRAAVKKPMFYSLSPSISLKDMEFVVNIIQSAVQLV